MNTPTKGVTGCPDCKGTGERIAPNSLTRIVPCDCQPTQSSDEQLRKARLDAIDSLDPKTMTPRSSDERTAKSESLSELVILLRHIAGELWPFAESVSNTRKPETDNNFGQANVAMKRAADLIESQSKELNEATEQLASVEFKHQIDLSELHEKLASAEMRLATIKAQWRKEVLMELKDWICMDHDARPLTIEDLDRMANEQGEV